MKIMTILGTRPEMIRLSRLIHKLDIICDHILIHTGQNYDKNLSGTFFDELEIRDPDEQFILKGQSAFDRVGEIISNIEKAYLKYQPDRVLILGDTDSGMAAYTANRMGIPVFHMEAGNRCFDNRVPEETNRRMIDHCSNILLPYTQNSKQNLLKEGIPTNRIFVTGNPIWEIMQWHQDKIDSSNTLNSLQLKSKEYFLATFHRAENVDIEHRLLNIISSLHKISEDYQIPVIISCHPRTRNRIKAINSSSPHLINSDSLNFLDPFGFADFIALEKNALCVLSDSGTVQEECSLLNVPTVTLRDVTERPETLECGSNILSGCKEDQIIRSVKLALSNTAGWTPPSDYTVDNVSETVARILLSHFEDLPRRTY